MSNYFFRPNASNTSAVAAEALREAQGAARKGQDATTELEFMKRDLDRLFMVTEALWTLLQRAHGYTDDELRNLVAEIDLRDGQLDGRSKGKNFVCPACNRPVSARHTTCIYCGQVLQHGLFDR